MVLVSASIPDHLDPLIPSHFGSSSYHHPKQPNYDHQPNHHQDTFPSTPRGGRLPDHTIRRRLKLIGLQFISAIISNLLLVIIVSYALTKRFIAHSYQSILNSTPHPTIIPSSSSKTQNTPSAPQPIRSWDDPQKLIHERITKDFHYYAIQAGFEIIEQVVETLDGYYLQVWKILKPQPNPDLKHKSKAGYPVLIQHGLFQSAGSFITSEERSLAFWLVEHGGYQVYLGNNRGIFNMGHRKLKRSDPRFWDYNMKELAIYDLPALVDHVLRDTGYHKLAFIGHSQGNATMFCSLAKGMIPRLGSKLSCFIALAPAVYAGPLTSGFPFGALKSMRWRTWRVVFGILDFLPIMSFCVDWLPSSIFGFLGYQMFAFLFNWTDRNWLLRRKLKMFRFTPSPVSSASIFWWTGYQGFSTRGCVLDPEVEQWWDERFPPLALYHGESDYLVLVDPLLKRLETHEKSVKLIRNYKLENGEHCDTFWHADAVELCFHLIVEDIEKTRDSQDCGIERSDQVTPTVELATNGGPPLDVTPHERLERMLCEPGSTDSKTREEILNRILYGHRPGLVPTAAAAPTIPVTAPVYPSSSSPSSPTAMTTTAAAAATTERRTQDSEAFLNSLISHSNHLPGPDLIDLDRDRHQAPVMGLDRDV